MLVVQGMVIFTIVSLSLVILLGYAPTWWVGITIILAFTSFPAAVPKQIEISGFGFYLYELPLFFGAVYLLLYRPSNRNTDLCALAIACITAAGLVHGFLAGNDLVAVLNDARGLLAMVLAIFVVGRIAFTPESIVAFQAVKIVLWASFGFVLLGAWGVLTLGARTEDASLVGAAFDHEAGVTRVIGQSGRLAAVVLAVSLALWVIRPDMLRRTYVYLIPALGITVVGFSRNMFVLVVITVALVPLINRGFRPANDGSGSSSFYRAGLVLFGGLLLFVAAGLFLSLTAGIPGLDYLRAVHAAYSSRVFEGLTTSARSYDQSALYRVAEIEWLKLAIKGNEIAGNGFGFRYQPPNGTAEGAITRTYYAHNFYWWALCKVGWIGLAAYVVAFGAPVVNAVFGRGGFALRSAAGAAVVGHLVTISVAPAPEDVFGAPVLGALIAIALLRYPATNSRPQQEASNLPEKKASFTSPPR